MIMMSVLPWLSHTPHDRSCLFRYLVYGLRGVLGPPGGGDVRILNERVDFRHRARPKVDTGTPGEPTPVPRGSHSATRSCLFKEFSVFYVNHLQF